MSAQANAPAKKRVIKVKKQKEPEPITSESDTSESDNDDINKYKMVKVIHTFSCYYPVPKGLDLENDPRVEDHWIGRNDQLIIKFKDGTRLEIEQTEVGDNRSYKTHIIDVDEEGEYDVDKDDFKTVEELFAIQNKGGSSSERP